MRRSGVTGREDGVGAEGIAKLIIEHAPQGIVLLDPNHLMTITNPAFCNILGYPQEELLGHRFLELLQGEDADIVEDMIDRNRPGEKPKRIAPVRYLHKKGKVLLGAFSVSGTVFDSSRSQYSILSIEDLSEHFDLQSKINVQAEKIRSLEREKVLSEVASGIAHEINQPLTAISVYAQSCLNLLERDGKQSVSGDLRRALTKLSQQVTRAGSVTDQIRALGRGRPPKNEAFDCNELVEIAIELAIANTLPTDFSVYTELAPGLPQLYFDPLHILLILVCLIRNAQDSIRSKNGGGHQAVKLITRQVSGDYVSISVIDSGWGVDEEVADLLFLPYSTTREENIGMGLAVSRSIADACGAELSYFNNAAGGATFSLLLPLGRTN